MTTATKERPIIFSTPTSWAIEKGRKTQTRRVVKINNETLVIDPQDCPHGKPGDRLWVRETFALLSDEFGENYNYKADYLGEVDWKWTPSIFMPRKASRILLEITSVRVERVQDISEKDAIAEGIWKNQDYWTGALHAIKGTHKALPTAIAGFQDLWDSINADRGYSWASNPWVWVVGFQKLEES